jgi:hypothetical protein
MLSSEVCWSFPNEVGRSRLGRPGTPAPLAHFREFLPYGQGEFVALGLSGGLGFGGVQRQVSLLGVAAA